MKFLDIVVFGKTSNDMADALDHAAAQLRMGTKSESISFARDDDEKTCSKVVFDIYPVDRGGHAQEKYENYLAEQIAEEEAEAT